MRIGQFTWDMHGRGGVQSYIRRLGAGLRERGHTLYNFSRTSQSEEVIAAPDDETLYRRAHDLRLDVLHLHKPVYLAPPDHLHVVRTVHDNTPSCPSGSRFLRRPRMPCNRVPSIGACARGHYIDHCGSVRPRRTLASLAVYRAEHRVLPHLPTIAISDYVKRQMVVDGYEPGLIRVIRSPAPATSGEWRPLPPTARFLFFGRLIPEKGAAWLLESAARVPEQIHIDIAGDGSQRTALEKLARALDISPRVTFHGWLQHHELVQLVRESRAVVFPSLWHEPAGLVTLEAAAEGRAVVASAVGGIPEYADPEFCLQVPPNDIEALRKALQKLASDMALASRLGRRAHELARAVFSEGDFLDAHEALYSSP